MEREFREKISLVFENLLMPLPVKQKVDRKMSITMSDFNEESSIFAISSNTGQKQTTISEEHLRNLFFGDFMKSKDEIRFYDEISDLDALKKVKY